MRTTRTAHLHPTSKPKNIKVTIINVINYYQCQYVDKDQPRTDRISQQLLNNNTNENTNKVSSKDNFVNNGYK